MKLTTAKSRVVGIQLGEASLNLIRMNEVPIKAKFALMTADGDVCGYVEKYNGWSDKVQEALRNFAEVLEEEGLKQLFEVTDAAESPQSNPDVAEPPQF